MNYHWGRGVSRVHTRTTIIFNLYYWLFWWSVDKCLPLSEDDALLFSVVRTINTSRTRLNKDLRKISNWTWQWKISFNPDLSKQGQEVSFSRKLQKLIILLLTSTTIQSSKSHFKNPWEWLWTPNLLFKSILIFKIHKNVLTKLNKTIGLLRKLQNILPRGLLLTISK